MMKQEKNTSVNISALVDTTCEKAVIGALINDKRAYHAVCELLGEEVFSDGKNKTIFRAIKNMIAIGTEVDMVTVTSYLLEHHGEAEVTPVDVAEIVSDFISSSTIEENSRVLRDLYVRRQLQVLLYSFIGMCGDRTKDICESISEISEKIQRLTDLPFSNVSTTADAVDELNENINKQLNGESIGSYSGIRCIDERGGLRPQALTVIGAQPGQGKSAIALTMAVNAATEGCPSGIFTLEMSKAELIARAVAAQSGVAVSTILNKPNDLKSDDWNKYNVASNQIRNLPIYFDEAALSSVDSIIQSTRMLVRRYHIKGIFVDYLQILANTNIKHDKGNEAFLGDTVRAFKNLAKQENIFVVLLSQLSRNQDSKEPDSDYLRGSGQIFEGCDNCYLLYRPEARGLRYYGEMANVDPHGTLQIAVAKCRNGRPGTKHIIGFVPETTKVYELDAIPKLHEFAKDYNEDVKAPLNY